MISDDLFYFTLKVDANDMVISGWDISSMNLGDAMTRAEVLEYDLQVGLR